MASAPFLRRALLPTACAIFIALMLLFVPRSSLRSTRFSSDSRLNWSLIGLRPAPRTSRLHYLVPASQPNLQLCYNLVSSIVNRYPVPMLLGWNGVGELDAAQTHLAKLRAMKRYLHSLPEQEDDDLAVIVDGYDIIHQLPAEIVVERYFDVANRADGQLADRLNMSVADARNGNLRQTLFWGPDKICFPFDPRAPRCWAAPPSPLGVNAFGPKTGNGEFEFNDPRWLNSGTVIGPVHDLRRLIDETMDEISATYDPHYDLRESDQYYVSNVWARQEYWRSKRRAVGGDVSGGPQDRVLPEKRSEKHETELHVAIDYESHIFQTKAGYEPFLRRLAFSDGDGNATTVNDDVLHLGDQFKPYPILMPVSVRKALTRLYDDLPDVRRGVSAGEWIRAISLGVNLVTKHIYAVWHCTGLKDSFDEEYRLQWWYPYTMSLLKAAVKSSQAGQLISADAVDGRRWAPKKTFPSSLPSGDVLYGGAWSDADGGRFVAWSELCAAHEEVLFRGERESIVASPPTPVVAQLKKRRSPSSSPF
ncbi:hypothetical protein L249_1339 [Ophiocordyceps polyrhachis-furcata BCC 54312]|uniref:Uncharacterized protein n=1 Tax=Ophiocordyceps polyrhachis-furcata BCC 54312 TaxID=1330021 RepID=A0A367LCV5_9HYPO|nr:hypothetical protein L249_1339 [Ophiocordyceps polyrhachis-furcata BCC 54312]